MGTSGVLLFIHNVDIITSDVRTAFQTNKQMCLILSLLTAIKTNKFNQSLRTTVALAELQGNHDTGSSLQDIQWKFRDYKVSDYAILDYCEVVQQFLVLLSLPVVHHHPEKVAETLQNSNFNIQLSKQVTAHLPPGLRRWFLKTAFPAPTRALPSSEKDISLIFSELDSGHF